MSGFLDRPLATLLFLVAVAFAVAAVMAHDPAYGVVAVFAFVLGTQT